MNCAFHKDRVANRIEALVRAAFVGVFAVVSAVCVNKSTQNFASGGKQRSLFTGKGGNFFQGWRLTCDAGQ